MGLTTAVTTIFPLGARNGSARRERVVNGMQGSILDSLNRVVRAEEGRGPRVVDPGGEGGPDGGGVRK